MTFKNAQKALFSLKEYKAYWKEKTEKKSLKEVSTKLLALEKTDIFKQFWEAFNNECVGLE